MTSSQFNLPDVSLDEALATLKPYQQSSLTELISAHGEEDAAKIWLASNGPGGIEKFGSSIQSPKPFWEKVNIEFRLFVCGDDKYEKSRQQLSELSEKHLKTIITGISVAIATTVGVAAALITPVITILCYLAGKIGVNAWCAT